MNSFNKERITKDIKATQAIIERNLKYKDFPSFYTLTKSFSPFPKNPDYDDLYANATEDMKTYYKEFKHPKSFLTIAASGEQIANAILTGAKVIDCFDINTLTIHNVYLRLGAIKALNISELLRFFNTFDYDLFTKILPYLSDEEQFYWQSIYKYYGNNSSDLIGGFLYTNKRLDIKMLKSINPYLSKDNYEKLKHLIDEVSIRFFNCNIYDLPSFIKDNMYDAITFSNIYEYLNYGLEVTMANALKYHNFIMNDIFPHLNNKGTIMFAYLYSFNREFKNRFDRLYEAIPEKLVFPGFYSYEDKIYLDAGLTSENLAYSQILEVFKDDNVIELPTKRVGFGQKVKEENDLALVLRRS